VICVGFEDWGTPGFGGQVGGVRLVLRTFNELVWRSGQKDVKIEEYSDLL